MMINFCKQAGTLARAFKQLTRYLVRADAQAAVEPRDRAGAWHGHQDTCILASLASSTWNLCHTQVSTDSKRMRPWMSHARTVKTEMLRRWPRRIGQRTPSDSYAELPESSQDTNYRTKGG
eukprot:6181677-Pleurochrysis_carterae.AAC.1